jgi:hypothetical protein
MSQDDGLFVESIMATFTQISPEARRRMKNFLDKRAQPIAAAKVKKPKRSGRPAPHRAGRPFYAAAK